MPPHELRQWRGLLARLCAAYTDRVPGPEARCLSLCGSALGMVFVFSLTELRYLYDLPTSATLQLGVDSVLSE